jgi:hypothetical protein
MGTNNRPKVRFEWAPPNGEIEIEDWWLEELTKHPEYVSDKIFDFVYDNFSPQLILDKEDIKKLKDAIQETRNKESISS